MKGTEYFPWTLEPEKRPTVGRAKSEALKDSQRNEKPESAEAKSFEALLDKKAAPHPENYIG